jgi:hypothetical protein
MPTPALAVPYAAPRSAIGKGVAGERERAGAMKREAKAASDDVLTSRDGSTPRRPLAAGRGRQPAVRRAEAREEAARQSKISVSLRAGVAAAASRNSAASASPGPVAAIGVHACVHGFVGPRQGQGWRERGLQRREGLTGKDLRAMKGSEGQGGRSGRALEVFGRDVPRPEERRSVPSDRNAMGASAGPCSSHPRRVRVQIKSG